MDTSDIDYTINHPGAFKFTLISCTSSNTDVISIGSNGKIYANKVGKSTIEIKLKDGDKEISISREIEVKDMIVSLYNNYGIERSPSRTINVGYGQEMPNITVPTRTSYAFLGFYDAKDGGNCYYGVDGKSVRDWDKTSNADLYAHWNSVGSNIYTITFVANGGTISSGIQSEYIPSSIDKDHYKLQLSSNNSIMTAFVQKNLTSSNSFWMSEKDNKENKLIISKEGYEFLGWYTSPTLGEGAEVYIFSNNSFEATGAGSYWVRENSKQMPKWHGTSSVTLYAQWKPKYVFGDGVVTFNKGANIETTATINGEVVNDIRGAVTDIIAKEAKQADIDQRDPIVENIISVIDLTKSNSSSGKFDTYSFMPYIEGNKHAQTGDSKVLSPNLLVFVNNTEDEDNVYDNLISDWQCQHLVVTDRYPMKIPYGFNAKKATYERNKDQIGTNDAMWQQSYNSVWGTLCLPYPITNNHSYRDESGIDYKIRFYELYGTHDNYMQFREMAENQRIEANTPVLYCRTAGVGSAVTVQESSSSGVEVPANIENGQYKVNSVLYSNELREEMKRNENAQRVVEEDWQFKGTLETKKFCTKAYSDLCIQKGAQAEFLAGAEVLDPDNEKIPYREIYYFKQDKFTHMTSGVTILPYRAYFDRKKIEESTDQIGESKVSSYSILVMDADGTTTDITNLIDNHEAKGNGKIYDLSGRRVKQPVKGSIYIVDGKKKMY
ncbi:MAG: InlB B-repeat-containing protein [Prevotellaceae bacterium]|nr:InlB B-repeat-containing protein [Prevotellaceae bacterium]